MTDDTSQAAGRRSRCLTRSISVTETNAL